MHVLMFIKKDQKGQGHTIMDLSEVRDAYMLNTRIKKTQIDKTFD